MSALDRDRFVAPGGLWSLWEMLRFHADKFVMALDDLSAVRALVLTNQGTHFDKKTGYEFCGHLDSLGEQLKSLQLRMTQLSVERLRAELDESYKFSPKMRHLLTQCQERIRDELGMVFLYSLSAEEAAFYQPAEHPFGSEFAAKFRSAEYEVDEAGKCYALSRSTATAFHLMRATEIGIRAVARCLQIPDPTKPSERNWGFILKAIKTEIDKRWTAASRHAGTDAAYFESIHASLDAIRNPWRNATMHVEIKYTPEEARHIFDAVNGFMRKLASRMDEDGLPYA